MHSCMHIYILAFTVKYLHALMPTCLHIYIPTYVRTYTHTHIHARIHTYMHTHTHIHAHTHTHRHTCMHAYIHVGVRMRSCMKRIVPVFLSVQIDEGKKNRGREREGSSAFFSSAVHVP